MTHTSPAVSLLWAISCTFVVCFYFYHLWCYDKFKCLKWDSRPKAGGFKRFMIYTYLSTLPLIGVYSLGMAIIKYKEGFIEIPGYGIIPKPWTFWDSAHKDAILPLLITFAFAWSLEMTTHLEELCFWLFLITASSTPQDWFKTKYYKAWVIGSVIACIYVPLVTCLTRSNPLKCEAWTMLVASLGSLSVTLWFFPILWMFPSFLAHLSYQGVDEVTITRLTALHELNLVRVVFRLLFVIPFVILGVDGIRPHQHVNEKMFATDILGIVAAVGCIVQSVITLVIFFPRSASIEYQRWRARFHIDGRNEMRSRQATPNPSVPSFTQNLNAASDDENDIADLKNSYAMQPMHTHADNNNFRDNKLGNGSIDNGDAWGSEVKFQIRLAPNRRTDVEPTTYETDIEAMRHRRRVHPMRNFISPIDTL